MVNRRFIPKKIEQIERKKLILKIVLIIVSILSILFAIREFINLKYFAIEGVSIEGTKYIDKIALEKSVFGSLDGTKLLLNRNSKFVFNKSNLNTKLIKEYPSIESLEIDVIDKEINIQVKERTPLAVWCADGRENCLYFDKYAILFSNSAEFEGEAYIFFRGGDYKIGEKINEGLRVIALTELSKSLEKIGVNVRDIDLNENMTDISAYTIDPQNIFTIRIDTNTDLIKLPLRLSLIIDEYKMKSSNNTKKVESIDMRYDNNIVVKIAD